MVDERSRDVSTGFRLGLRGLVNKTNSILLGVSVPVLALIFRASVSLLDGQSPDGMYVSLWMKGLQRKPVDGVNERAIERQSPGKLSGGLLISLLRSGYRALKSSQSIVKLWNC